MGLKIEKEILILVEGTDDIYFLEEFLKHLELSSQVTIQTSASIFDIEEYYNDKGKLVKIPTGINGIEIMLPSILKESLFREKVKKMGIIIDSDKDPSKNFSNIEKIVKKVNLANIKLGSKIGIFGTKNNPDDIELGVFTIPGDNEDGMLETICYNSIKDNEKEICDKVETYIEDICKIRGKDKAPTNIHKTRLQVYLASQKTFTTSAGQGARNGFWNFDAPEMQKLKNFLIQLCK